jgi:hypothetical protein
MEDISQVIEKRRLPLEIIIRPYLGDHRFDGRAVYPAVEAMQLLARSCRSFRAGIDTSTITGVAFHKFLYLEHITDQTVTEIINEIHINQSGRISARLLTKNRLKKSSMTRLKEHVTLHFSGTGSEVPVPKFETATSLKGTPFKITARMLYRDLVPFGPAYQNILDDLIVTEKGAVAHLQSPSYPAPLQQLGSPFPLDAAFHAACAWGQRFSTIVGFPVGFDERTIFRPTQPGEKYISRITPVRQASDPVVLIFDIWIYTEEGYLCEAVRGVQMRDVSGGRLKPPRWVQQDR